MVTYYEAYQIAKKACDTFGEPQVVKQLLNGEQKMEKNWKQFRGCVSTKDDFGDQFVQGEIVFEFDGFNLKIEL